MYRKGHGFGSVCGFGCPRGSWNVFPEDKGLLSVFGTSSFPVLRDPLGLRLQTTWAGEQGQRYSLPPAPSPASEAQKRILRVWCLLPNHLPSSSGTASSGQEITLHTIFSTHQLPPYFSFTVLMGWTCLLEPLPPAHHTPTCLVFLCSVGSSPKYPFLGGLSILPLFFAIIK